MSKILLKIAVWTLLKGTNYLGADQLTDERALELRRQIEIRLHDLATRPQGKWRKKITLDDQALRFVQVVLKSKWLECQRSGKPYPCH